MKRFILAMTSLTLALGAFALPARGADDQVKALVEGQRKFALELYQRLDQQKGNLFFSPYSIDACMAMTASGAAGDTRAEMLKALHLPETFATDFQAQGKSLKANGRAPAFTLSIANAVWVQEGQPFLPQFQATVKDDFGGDTQLLDFKDATAAADKINAWVKEQTHAKIEQIVDAGSVKNARIVLANAVYFKGAWVHAFSKDATKDADFALASDKTVKVPMMHQTDHFAYAENELCQVLALPYDGGSMAMLIVLPKKADQISEVEKNLGNLSALNLESRKVAVSLPRFKTEPSYDLTQTLKDMGLSRAFAPDQADFSGITGDRSLYISQVMHKAFVDVNEEGTEAAAVTVGVMTMSAMPQEEKIVNFTVDHPFIFAIQDLGTGQALFMGRIVDPR